MHAICLQENLAKGLSIVGRVVSSRTSLPVLANILLKAESPAQVRLSATNLDITVNCWLSAQVKEEGATTVPAKLFNEYISSLPAEPVDLKLSVRTEQLHVTCARTQTNFKVIDASEFPIIPEAEESTLQIASPTLRQMIQQVVFAASTDESRPNLTGVLVVAHDDMLSMVATDGYRLSFRRTHLPEKVADDARVIVPARSLSEVARGAADADDDHLASISFTPNRSQAIFVMTGKESAGKSSFQRLAIVSQLLEATFPKYEAIIPKSYTTKVTTATAGFLQAARRAYLFVRDSNNIVKLHITPGETGQIHFFASSHDLGDHESILDAVGEGPEMDIAFNVRFLIDVLAVIDTPEVSLELTAADRPGVVRPVGSGDEEFLHVIMPMNPNR